MKIGMPTLIELDSLEENVKLCKELDLDFVEINMNFPQYQLEKLSVKMLNNLQQEYDVFFTFHIAEDIDIAHLNKRIRNVYVDEIISTLTLMDQINSKILNIHMSQGIYVTLPTEKVYIYDKYKSEYLNNIAEFVKKINGFVAEKDMSIFIENTGHGDVSYISEGIKSMLESDNFKLTWDIGHDHSSGNKDKNFLIKNIEKIKHYHIHDAIGGKNHLELYTGDIKIEEFLVLASESKSTVVFETKTIEALKNSVVKYRLHENKIYYT